MAVELIDFVESLKREIQPPGTELFGTVTDEQWVGYLSDAFWEARLDGFLAGYDTDGDGEDIEVIPVVTGGTDIDRRGIALVILYAGIKVLRNRILNMSTSTSLRAKAGPVEFEQESQNSATMLAEMLKQLKATKDRILDELLTGTATDTMVLDAFSTRVYSSVSYYGGHELAGGF